MDITIHMTDGESVTVTPRDPAKTLRSLQLMMERQAGTYTITRGVGDIPAQYTVAGAHIVRLSHDDPGRGDLISADRY